MNPYYPHLFEPLKLKNGMTMKNRIVASPTHHSAVSNPPNNLFNETGCVLYGERAQGGAAVVTIGEGKMGDMTTCAHDSHVNCYEPNAVFAFHNYTSFVHGFGGLASIEFNHGGHFSKEDPKSASAFMTPQGWFSREMTEDDMNRVADQYANACLMAKKAGFDMVCLHFAHGWLMGGFLSPMVNQRTDQYGGSVENRCRFPLMVLKRIREMVGNDLALEVRLSGEEYVPEGLHIEDVVEIAKLIEDKVDLIQITCGTRLHAVTRALMHPTHFVSHGHNAVYARKVKEAVSVPVGCVGAVTDPELAEKMIAEGYCDYIVMARALIADPDWGEKARYGHAEQIRPCIKCLRCLDITAGRVNTATRAVLDNPKAVQKTECSVNPLFGNNMIKSNYPPVKEKKKVVIVGGGVAGMQAALTTSQRGHEVVLFEKQNKLGGQLFYADHVWFKSDMKKYREYMVRQVMDSSVTVKLNTEATSELVQSEKPDAVLVATGAIPIIPPIKGVDNQNVVPAIEVFGNEDKLGKKVVIVGGGMVGCETALHLTSKGYDVVIVEMGEILAPDAIFTERMHTLEYMEKDTHLTYQTSTKCVEIKSDGIQVLCQDGTEKFIAADSVVLSAGMKPDVNTFDMFDDCAIDIIRIGDCSKTGTIYTAVHSAFDAASVRI